MVTTSDYISEERSNRPNPQPYRQKTPLWFHSIPVYLLPFLTQSPLDSNSSIIKLVITGGAVLYRISALL